MLKLSDVRGAIFDVDDTLLNTFNNRYGRPVDGLHERARLQAFHEIGKQQNIPILVSITPEENLRGFVEAPVHSLEAAVWHTMYLKGLVATDQLEPDSPLLQAVVTRKDEVFEELLRTDGKPFPGAVEFVSWLAKHGPGGHFAIASTAIRRDITIFLEMTGLDQYFPSECIVSKDDITHAKPNPEAFNKAFMALKLSEQDRSHVLAFEDNPRGIMSARAAGLFTCAITTVCTREQLETLTVAPDLVADSFDEFRTLFESTGA